MDNDARMKEMESLLQQASHFIPETDEPFWHRRARTILTPPPDPDALASTAHDVMDAAFRGTARTRRNFSDLKDHEKVVARAVAAWIEADRITTWNAALDEAREYIGELGRGDRVDLQCLRKPSVDAP